MAISRADSLSRYPVVGIAVGLATVGSNLLKIVGDVAIMAKRSIHNKILDKQIGSLNKKIEQIELTLNPITTANHHTLNLPIRAKADAVREKIGEINRIKEQNNQPTEIRRHVSYLGVGLKRCVPGYGKYFWKLPKN